MNASDGFLALLLVYGMPVLFCGTALCSLGVPIPGLSLLLVAAGSYAYQGQWSLGEVLLGAGLGSIVGDLCGFFLARWAGRERVLHWAGRFRLEGALRRAIAMQRDSVASTVFLTRWLLPLGPWVNVTCGLSDCSWRLFARWCAVGQSLWVLLYVIPGYLFSERVQALTEMLGDLVWMLVGVVLAGFLGWQIWRGSRRNG